MESQNNHIAELKQRQAELQDWLAQNPTPCLLRTLKSRHLTDVNIRLSLMSNQPAAVISGSNAVTHRENHQGYLVPVANIKQIDLLRDEVVQDIAAEAEAIHAALKAFKTKAFKDIAAFQQTSLEQYGVKVGGDKGHMNLLSFDGKYKVQRSAAPRMEFTESIHAAKLLVDELLVEWSKASHANLAKIVSEKFRLDESGRYNVKEILSLQTIEIDDDRWHTAMKAINDSIKVVGSASYIRVYKRNEHGGYDPLTLDLATI